MLIISDKSKSSFLSLYVCPSQECPVKLISTKVQSENLGWSVFSKTIMLAAGTMKKSSGLPAARLTRL